MESQYFDELARKLAKGTTRRSTLKMLGGAIAGLAAAFNGGRKSEVVAGEICGELLECCDNCQEFRHSGGTIRAFPQLQSVACCGGLACLPSQEQGEDFKRCYECLTETENCETNADCCEDFICGEDNTCQTPVSCTGDGEACELDEECCAGICCAGICRDIECCIDESDPNARCPEGTSCFEGICEEIICSEAGGDCEKSDQCCQDLVCTDGTCAVLSTCTEEGDSCTEESTCCGDAICIDAICTVPRLPDTGVGTGDPLDSMLTGGILAAGAAALLASKLAQEAISTPASEPIDRS